MAPCTTFARTVPAQPTSIVLLVLLLAAGCAPGTAVRVNVPVPPRLAVRVFPEVIVVSGRTPDEVGLADGIVAHLARSGRGRIERVSTQELALRQASGAFGPATAILAIEARVQERLAQPTQDRGSAWCRTERCWGDAIVVVDATLRLRLSEARSGRVLQEIELRERDGSADASRRRGRALDRLRAGAIAALDPTQVAVTLFLVDVDDPEVRAAVALLRDGEPRRARRTLDRVVRHASFAERAPSERARVLFDLGQALRLEARDDARNAAHVLDAAERILRRAALLDPGRLYLDAVTQVVTEREAEQRMRDIDDATHANFAVALPAEVPRPPLGYGYATAP